MLYHCMQEIMAYILIRTFLKGYILKPTKIAMWLLKPQRTHSNTDRQNIHFLVQSFQIPQEYFVVRTFML